MDEILKDTKEVKDLIKLLPKGEQMKINYIIEGVILSLGIDPEKEIEKMKQTEKQAPPQKKLLAFWR